MWVLPRPHITSDTHNQIQGGKNYDVAEGEIWPGNNTTCMHIGTQAHTRCWNLSAAVQGPSYWTRQIVTSFDSSGHTQMRATNCLAGGQTWLACDRKRHWRFDVHAGESVVSELLEWVTERWKFDEGNGLRRCVLWCVINTCQSGGAWWHEALSEEDSETPLVPAKLRSCVKVNMNHTGSLTLAWPQCRAEKKNGKEREQEEERERQRERERIKHT